MLDPVVLERQPSIFTWDYTKRPHWDKEKIKEKPPCRTHCAVCRIKFKRRNTKRVLLYRPLALIAHGHCRLIKINLYICEECDDTYFKGRKKMCQLI